MKTINRDKIQRMIGTRAGGGGGSSIGGDIDLTGMASQIWVDENYVSKEFFARLFTIHGHDAEDESDPPTDITVEPNDLDTPIDSIEAMFGLWTQEFVSALGQGSGGGGGGGGASALYDLYDVVPNDAENPTMVFGLTGDPIADDGKVLTYSGTYGHWIAADPQGTGTITEITINTPIGILVNGGQSATVGTEPVEFTFTLDDGFYLLSESQYDILDNLRYSSWWGQPILNGVVYGAMTNVPSIDNLLFFDTSNFQTYFAVGGNYNSKFTFLENMMHQSILSMMNDGEVDATQALVLKSGELVINNSPTSNSGKNLALFANDTMFFDTGTSERMRIDSDGWVGIGLTNPYTMLDVAGGVMAQKFYLYKPNKASDTGAIYFQVEYENNVAIGVHLYGGGVSTDTYVTALGVGSGSGGGGATSLTQLSDVNPNMNPQAGNVLTYLNGKWTAAAPSSGGSVTSISAGTGLTSSTGGAITSTGTISIDSTTMGKINNGASAYNSLSNYVQTSDIKTLSLQGNGTNVITFTPNGANATFNIESGTGIGLVRGTNKVTLSLAQVVNAAGTWRSVTVDNYGRVTAGTNPTTLAAYGITTSDVMWSQITAGNASRLSTVSKSAWGQTYWTSGGVPTTIKGSLTDDYFQLFSSSSNPYLRLGTSSSTWRVQLLNNILYFGVGTSTSLKINGSGNVGIGGPVNMSYILNITGAVYMSSKLDVNGIATVGNLKSNGYVTALSSSSSSDERMKNIIEHFVLPVEDIAAAPIVRFTWKNGEDKAVHAGSIAQYWEKKLPESVLEVDGFLSLEYGVLALLSAISLAREMVNLKQRVARIEKELFN